MAASVCYLTAFYKKTPFDGYWQLLKLLWPETCRVMSVSRVRYRISKKCNKNFIKYFFHSKNGMIRCVSTQNFFQLFQIRRHSEIKKKIVVHRKPFTKIIRTLLLMARIFKSLDQTIVQIIMKK